MWGHLQPHTAAQHSSLPQERPHNIQQATYIALKPNLQDAGATRGTPECLHAQFSTRRLHESSAGGSSICTDGALRFWSNASSASCANSCGSGQPLSKKLGGRFWMPASAAVSAPLPSTETCTSTTPQCALAHSNLTQSHAAMAPLTHTNVVCATPLMLTNKVWAVGVLRQQQDRQLRTADVGCCKAGRWACCT